MNSLERSGKRQPALTDRRYVDKAYDEKGYLTHVSEPYFENGTPQWTVTEYDDLGRATTITQPGNRVTNTDYNGLTTTIVNPLNQIAAQTVDVQGFVLSLLIPTGSNPLGF